MSVDLEFYLLEESSGVKTKITDMLDIGALFKGSEKKIPIMVFNKGTEAAVSPKVTIAQYFIEDGQDYSDAVKWKSISLDKNSGFTTTLTLPDIQPNSWMSGKDIYIEDFSQYAITNSRPDQNWTLWAGSEYAWTVYAGRLQHNQDTQHGRAMWGVFPPAKNFTLSMKIRVDTGVWGGVLLRDTGDYDTGYIILVQGQAQYFGGTIPQNEGCIQVWKGKFSLGESNWTKIYQSGTIGIRGVDDYFKIKLTDNRFDFWYQNQHSAEPLYSFIDNANNYTNASRPILLSHSNIGQNIDNALTYFDELTLEIPNSSGTIWVKDAIDKDTHVFGRQYTVFKVEYGGE